MSHSLVRKQTVLLKICGYWSNRGVLYTIGISIMKGYKKMKVRPFVTLTKNAYSFIIKSGIIIRMSFTRMAGWHSRDCFEWHPARCCHPQQSFNYYPQVCWRHRPCASWSRIQLCETPRQGLRHHSICVPHEEVQKPLLNCLLWAILKYTTITTLFLRCHSRRASGALNKSQIKRMTRIVTKSLFNFFRPTRYIHTQVAVY